MEMAQIMISSIFSLMGFGAILFIAARAYSVGTDIGEIKELLRDMKRNSKFEDTAAILPHLQNPELGTWPSVADPSYRAQADVPYGLRPVEEQHESTTGRTSY